MANTKKKKDNKEYKYIECECKTHKGRKLLREDNFYTSKSPLFTDGRVHICKKCLNEMIDYDDIQTIYRVLQLLDFPFIYDCWDKMYSRYGNTAFGRYLRQVGNLHQFEGFLWKDSIFDSSMSVSIQKNDTKKEVEKNKKEEIKKDEEMVYSDEWRGTYTLSDLEYLNEYYKDLNKDFKIVTRNHKDYARKIAKASLAMDRAYDDMINGIQGADTRYKNLQKTFDEMSKSAQFAEEKRGANDVGLGCFGVTFAKVEKHNWIPKHTPVEKDDYDKLLDAFSTIKKSL